MAAAVLLTARPFQRADLTSAHVQPEAVAQAETLSVPVRLDTRKPAVDSLKTVAVEGMPKPEIQSVASVTIMGCLEHNEDTFWLKNTSGVDAPKSRGWRSGFLKKGQSPVELVDATTTLNLSNYVGQRVAVTGMLTNRDMRVRSLQRVAASCS